MTFPKPGAGVCWEGTPGTESAYVKSRCCCEGVCGSCVRWQCHDGVCVEEDQGNAQGQAYCSQAVCEASGCGNEFP